MRVVVTGDRYGGRFRPGEDPDDMELAVEKRAEAGVVFKALSTLDPATDFVVLGDALGTDSLARIACAALGLPHRVHEADWDRYHRAAGPIRNTAMLDDLGKESLLDPEPREVWYFNKDLKNSKGTKNCVEQARERGLTIRNGTEVGQ
jgi:hypothetical protein